MIALYVSPISCPLFTTLSLVVAVAIGTALAVEPLCRPFQPRGNGNNILTYTSTVSSNTFTPKSVSFDWMAADEDDGTHITTADEGTLILANVATGDSRNPYRRIRCLPTIGITESRSVF